MLMLSYAIDAPYNYDLSENKIHKTFQNAVDGGILFQKL